MQKETNIEIIKRYKKRKIHIKFSFFKQKVNKKAKTNCLFCFFVLYSRRSSAIVCVVRREGFEYVEMAY